MYQIMTDELKTRTSSGIRDRAGICSTKHFIAKQIMVPKFFFNYRKHHVVLNGIRIVLVRNYLNIQKQYTCNLQWRIQEFPEMAARTFQGAPTYYFARISQKLHEKEFGPDWGRGWACPKLFYYVDPQLL